MDYRKEIGFILKAQRTKQNLSQAALANKSGVSESAIKRIESPTYSRTNSIALDVIFKLSKALEVEPSIFINPTFKKWIDKN